MDVLHALGSRSDFLFTGSRLTGDALLFLEFSFLTLSVQDFIRLLCAKLGLLGSCHHLLELLANVLGDFGRASQQLFFLQSLTVELAEVSDKLGHRAIDGFVAGEVFVRFYAGVCGINPALLCLQDVVQFLFVVGLEGSSQTLSQSGQILGCDACVAERGNHVALVEQALDHFRGKNLRLTYRLCCLGTARDCVVCFGAASYIRAEVCILLALDE